MSQGGTSAAALWTPPPLVTSLPANPVDGREVYYVADAANGIIWHLRYRAANPSAYKWEYIGGPPMETTASARFTTSSTAPVLVTGGPTITFPLSGIWDMTILTWAASNIGNGGIYFELVNPAITVAAVGYWYHTITNVHTHTLGETQRNSLGAVAGQAWALRMCVDQSSAFVDLRYLRIVPVAVG
jgi:hypothetical protein